MASYKVKKKDCQLFVKVKLGRGEKLNEAQLKFMSVKNIRGLLRPNLLKTNVIEYSGPVGISLAERLKRPMSKNEFLFIMEQIVDLSQKIAANNLVMTSLVFDVKNVFINEITRELQFVYLPLEQMSGQGDMASLMEQIIYASKPMPEQDMDYVARYVYFIRSLKSFDAHSVEKFIQKEAPEVVATIKRHSVSGSGYITDKPADYMKHYNGGDDDATGLLVEDDATGLLVEEEATGLLVEDDATTLLVETPKAAYAPKLVRLSTDETIFINKPVFRVGKDRTSCSYCVFDNDKVSRNHADFIIRNNRYFIVDLNSKNRTFVNEVPISPQQEMEIHFGDRIRMANEEFEFRA